MTGRCTQPSCAIFDETLADIDAFLKRVEAIGVRGIGGQKWAERENDNARANRATSKMFPGNCRRVAACLCKTASMQNGKIKSRGLTASVVGRRGSVVIRT